MRTESTTIINKLGLHARAATKLVHCAGGYGCDITLKTNNNAVDAKSIMNVMLLAAAQDTEIELTTDGDDEDQAMDALLALIADRFGEAQ